MNGYLTISEVATRLDLPKNSLKMKIQRLEKRGVCLFDGRPKRISESRLPDLCAHLGILTSRPTEDITTRVFREFDARLTRLEILVASLE